MTKLYYGKTLNQLQGFLATKEDNDSITVKELEDFIEKANTENFNQRGQDGYSVAKTLSDFVNVMTHDKEGFINTLLNDHRTLQNDLIMLIFSLFEGYTNNYNKGLYDDRNEYSYRLVAQIISQLKSENKL